MLQLVNVGCYTLEGSLHQKVLSILVIKEMNNTKLMHNHLVSYMRRYLQKYDSYGKKGFGQEQPVIHSSRYSLLPRIE